MQCTLNKHTISWILKTRKYIKKIQNGKNKCESSDIARNPAYLAPLAKKSCGGATRLNGYVHSFALCC